jgi:CheY-like chemotaxis protein
MTKGLEMTPLSDAALLGKRVLVADDVAPTRWSYVGLLRGAGARVTEARDGLEALALARANRPDLILADMAMPRLDGLGLCAALREEPTLDGVPVVLLSDGAPPQAVWGSDVASRPLVDAVLAALGSWQAEPPPVRLERSPFPSNEPIAVVDSEWVVDGVERENIRAQSTVAMHREPANHVPRPGNAVWRLRASAAPEADGSASGFGAELSVMSRILGLGFLTLLGATVGLITWRTVTTPQSSAAREEHAQTVPTEAPSPEPPPNEEAVPMPARGVAAFSGALRSGVDPTIGVLAGQGVLELDGPTDVRVTIDGEEVGTLPVSLPLDEGRHRVRYAFEEATIDRFYFVKSGATRVLTVVTRPGGFVDAR